MRIHGVPSYRSTEAVVTKAPGDKFNAVERLGAQRASHVLQESRFRPYRRGVSATDPLAALPAMFWKRLRTGPVPKRLRSSLP